MLNALSAPDSRHLAFFLADIHEPILQDTPSGRTIKQIKGLLETIDKVIERPRRSISPEYDRANLSWHFEALSWPFMKHGDYSWT